MMNNTPFAYHPAILERFQTIAGVTILAKGLANQLSPVNLLDLYRIEQEKVKHQIGETPLSDLPTLAGWRSAFRQFGVDPTQYRNAAEALLRRLTKKGDIPSINTLVDCCNLISIRYALPVAAIDMKQVSGTITVQFADGTEHFNPLGEDQPGPPTAREVIFMDEKRMVVARRWCWRQSVESAAGLDTTEVLITIEAQDASGQQVVDQAGYELQALLQQYTGGEYQIARIV
jgi:DNA/RNA-binding domain of Phe-tRNA-synthetase-like protein